MGVIFKQNNKVYYLKTYRRNDKGLVNYLESISDKINVDISWVSDVGNIKIDREFRELSDIANILLNVA